MPELALAGARIIATKIADGTINVILRFMSFLGAINTAFRDNVGFEFAISDYSSTLSAKVLDDIAAPLLNICSAIETGCDDVVGKLGEFGQNIANRGHELRFHIELLSRFVQQQEKLMCVQNSQNTLNGPAYDINHEMPVPQPKMMIKSYHDA